MLEHESEDDDWIENDMELDSDAQRKQLEEAAKNADLPGNKRSKDGQVRELY